MRGRAAYWIADRGVYRCIEVKLAPSGLSDFVAALPPTMLTNDDAGVELIVQAGTGARAAKGGLYRRPVSCRDAAFLGGSEVHFHFWMRCALAEAWQSAMLALSEQSRLGAGEHEREAVDQFRLR
jgi:hypothetical protein